MKKILALVLTLVLAMSLFSGCSSKPAEGETTDQGTADAPKKVAVLIPGSVAYFTATRAGSEEAAAKYGLELTFFDANWDVATQLSQIEDAITSKFDMIALCASDAEGILPGIEAANEAGIPIMSFTNAVGSDATGTVDGLVTYVGQDEVATGRLCAQITSDLLGEEGGKVVSIEGKNGTFCQIYRQQGFLEGIKDTKIDVVYTQSGEWDKNTAMSIMEDLISSGQKIDAVFCQDDGMAAGVGRVLTENGLKDSVYVIGLGGSIDGIQAMRDGLIDGNTFMSAKEEGFKAVEACAKHLNGETLDARTPMVQVEVTKENIDQFTPEW